MSALLAPVAAPVHTTPELIARHVDGREIPPDSYRHIRDCELCRARASDARLLRALLAGKDSTTEAQRAIPLDAATIAGYHDQALPADQLAAVDRLLLRDDSALLEIIEMRLALNAALRADNPDTQLVARTAAAFATAQEPQSLSVAALGTLIIDRDSQVPVFHFHDATPENLACMDGPGRNRAPEHPHVNDSGSFPAPAARREVALHAGRHTIRVRIGDDRIELFVFDEQNFRPANGVQIAREPDDNAVVRHTTGQSGSVSFRLPAGHARLSIDAGDRWLLELR